MKTPHTVTFKGKRCRVELKDGTVFIDKFVERTAGKRVIFEHHEVRQGDIKAFSHYRAQMLIGAHRKS